MGVFQRLFPFQLTDTFGLSEPGFKISKPVPWPRNTCEGCFSKEARLGGNDSGSATPLRIGKTGLEDFKLHSILSSVSIVMSMLLEHLLCKEGDGGANQKRECRF